MFKDFTEKVRNKLQDIVDNHEVLFLTDVEREEIWEMYLSSFPKGTNNVYIERNSYECNTCKQFLRPYGNIVAIDENNKLVSIWDITIDGYYQDVANSLSEFVKSKLIKNVFIHLSCFNLTPGKDRCNKPMIIISIICRKIGRKVLNLKIDEHTCLFYITKNDTFSRD